MLKTCIGVNTDSWSHFAKQRMRLLMNLKGCGLRQVVDRRHAQFIGVLAQSIPPLFDRKDNNGNMIAGRLPIPKIVEIFGENAADSLVTDSWELLITFREA